MPHTLATVLSGNSEGLIAEAIRSVREWVDGIILIDTGITDGSRRIAEDLVGERLMVEPFAWRNDFAAARNFALEAAARHGATWALTIDTDERMECFSPGAFASREDLKAELDSDPRVRAWMVRFRDGSYAKERFIRVGGPESAALSREQTCSQSAVSGEYTRSSPGPGLVPAVEDGSARGASGLRWSGRTHECLTGFRAGERAILEGVAVWEVRKTPAAFRAKLVRDLAVLLEETAAKPDESRWWYYLGQTYEGLAQPTEALNAFRRCGEIRHGWAEQAAWACYKGASMALALQRHDEALDLCTLGLERQPESPELAWLAGYVCYRMGRLDQAIEWSRIAIALGHVEGRRAGRERISFRHLPGWYEGPYDVLRYAYRKLGQGELAAKCEAKFQAAKRQRDLSREQTCSRSAASGESTRGSPGPGLVPAREDGARVCEPGTPQRAFSTARDPRQGVGIRVAVLGLYSSGSTATATMLHHLGVCLGREFFADYYEPLWLAEQLRGWWQEPELVELEPQAERVRILTRWIVELEGEPRAQDSARGASGPQVFGAKHPLLTLCGPDLIKAWGPETKFVWCWRPLEESIASLVRRRWWPGREEAIQRRLWQAAEAFFATQRHLRIEFADVLRHPKRQVERLIDFLGLEPTPAQAEAATASIRRRGDLQRAVAMYVEPDCGNP